MQVTLSGLENVYVYMDDILVFSKTLKEHELIIDKVFKRLSFHGIKLSLKNVALLLQRLNTWVFFLPLRG